MGEFKREEERMGRPSREAWLAGWLAARPEDQQEVAWESLVKKLSGFDLWWRD